MRLISLDFDKELSLTLDEENYLYELSEYLLAMFKVKEKNSFKYK